jgi:hypothetical protein
MAPGNNSDDRPITKKVSAGILGLASMNGVQSPVRVNRYRCIRRQLSHQVRNSLKAEERRIGKTVTVSRASFF